MNVAKNRTVVSEHCLRIVPEVSATPTRREEDARADENWNVPLRPTGSCGTHLRHVGPAPLSVGETASRLGVCPGRVRRMLRGHRLSGLKFRDEWYVSAGSVRSLKLCRN